MVKVKYDKLDTLRQLMHFSVDYLSQLLYITTEEYMHNVNSYHMFDDKQLDRIITIFGVSREFLQDEEMVDNPIHELYAFQKMIAQDIKNKNEEV